MSKLAEIIEFVKENYWLGLVVAGLIGAMSSDIWGWIKKRWFNFWSSRNEKQATEQVEKLQKRIEQIKVFGEHPVELQKFLINSKISSINMVGNRVLYATILFFLLELIRIQMVDQIIFFFVASIVGIYCVQYRNRLRTQYAVLNAGETTTEIETEIKELRDKFNIPENND